MNRNEKPHPRHLQHRINPNNKAMTRPSIDLKVMPRSYKGCNFILVVNDEVHNVIETIPIYHTRSEEIGDVLIENV